MEIHLDESVIGTLLQSKGSSDIDQILMLIKQINVNFFLHMKNLFIILAFK